jgi:hypothetical protein
MNSPEAFLVSIRVGLYPKAHDKISRYVRLGYVASGYVKLS